MRVDVTVELKSKDLVSETALRTLREDLRWSACLERLSRANLWRFVAEDCEPAALRGALEREVERGSTYYNPNKERIGFLAAPALGAGDQLSAAEALPPGERGACLWLARLWVTDEEGARGDLLRGAASRFAEAGIRLASIHTGTLWALELRAANRAEARGRVAGMAISRGRGEGLLLNPHYQEGRLLDLVEIA